MAKYRQFLSCKKKKRRMNDGLLKWKQRHLAERSIPQNRAASSASVEGVSNDHASYCRKEGHETSQLPSPNEHFNEEQIPSTSTPQEPNVRVKQTRRKLLMDSAPKDIVHDSSGEQLEVNEFLSNTVTSEDYNDGIPVSSLIKGRRIIDFTYFFKQIKLINEHNNGLGCTISNCYPINEKCSGLRSKVTLKCSMCNQKFVLCSEDPYHELMDINTASVAGAMAVGIGHTQMRELLACMEIPYMTHKTYSKVHDKVSDAWEDTALCEMKTAISEEVEYALGHGHVSPDGVPILTVVADGSWAKRSYRTNYNSLSGVAAIVGLHTKKVVFLGVRNKYCTVCARATSSSRDPPEHICYKNWTSSSSSMEADIILEGFMRSIEMYGVMYGRILADGDSSVYATLLEARPYQNLTIEKIECTNHLLRNFCNKLKEITVNSKIGPIVLRKNLGRNILRLRTAITKAVDYRKLETKSEHEKLMGLSKDIINAPSHVFGEHLNCAEYFCKGPKHEEVNFVPELKKTGIYQQIMKNTSYLADNSRSLLMKMNNNAVENFNSIVAKFIGGKRVNFAVKRSYKARCLAAAVSHNTCQPLYKLHKTMYKQSPGSVMKKQQNSKKRKVQLKAAKRNENPKKRRKIIKSNKEKKEDAKHYGDTALKPDMPVELYEKKVEDFLENLKRSEQQRHELERGTLLQAGSGRWKEERRKLLTASNFGTVCKRRTTTSCQNLVKSLLYKDFDSSSTAYGKENEHLAVQHFEQETGLTVTKCGLFIDPNLFYLGATPDGLIGEDGLLEVKCPFSCQHLTPEEGVMSRKFKLWKIDKNSPNTCTVDKTHQFYYQIQGQLHITKRDYCHFVMWTPLGIKTERIIRDDSFWHTEMEGKLTSFYMDCMLPELVDPRHTRSMPIRDPPSIIEAMKKVGKKENKS